MQFRLRQVRRSLGLRQADLAGRLGISRVLISYLECGRKSPSLTFVTEIAQALEVPAWHLVDWDAPATPTGPHRRTQTVCRGGSLPT